MKVADSSFYVRPTGRLAPSGVAEGGIRPAGLAVAGRADCLFAAAELIERSGGGEVRRRTVSAEELGGLVPPDLFERIARPREPIAGLAFDRPLIMGVVNVTPDSFSEGGRYLAREAAIAHALQLEAEGADILDIGGESTRPGADPVGLEEELGRIMPVIEALAPRVQARLSIDTRKAEVMRRAAQAGAHLFNDVSALAHDPGAMQAAADTGSAVVLMHAQGDSRTMQDRPHYGDVVLDIYDWLGARIDACERAGIPRSRFLIDPGIGFGKTLAHNLALLGSLSIFHGLGCAVVLGASRKSFIGHLTGADTGDRLGGSIAAALLGVAQGVQVVRVHDVAATRQAVAVWERALGARGAPPVMPG